jgi:flagellar protein FlaG
MADQVNPLGNLAVGVAQTQVVAKPSPSPTDKTSKPAKVADSQPQGQGARPTDASAQNLDEAAKTIKDYLQNSQSDLSFSVDKGSGDMVFKVVNSTTHEVIRQVPTEDVLVMARKLRQLSHAKDASGVLMDKEG